MKRNINSFVRQGWHLAEIPRKNLYDFFNSDDWGNRKHYEEICSWCKQTFLPGSWRSSLAAPSGTSKPGVKRFVFKNEKDKTLFLLRWK